MSSSNPAQPQPLGLTQPILGAIVVTCLGFASSSAPETLKPICFSVALAVAALAGWLLICTQWIVAHTFHLRHTKLVYSLFATIAVASCFLAFLAATQKTEKEPLKVDSADYQLRDANKSLSNNMILMSNRWIEAKNEVRSATNQLAELQSELRSATNELLHIRRITSARLLNEKEVETVTALLKDIPAKESINIKLSPAMFDSEANGFAIQLENTLKSAGCNASNTEMGDPSSMLQWDFHGQLIMIRSLTNVSPQIIALQKAFQSIGKMFPIRINAEMGTSNAIIAIGAKEMPGLEMKYKVATNTPSVAPAP